MSMKKEDLVKTYIVNDNGPLRDAYISACKEHIEVSYFYRDAFRNDEHLYFNPSYDHLQFGYCDSDNYKQIHLSDLIDLENSKVYTTCEVVIRKYAELCGFKGRILFDAKGVHIGVAFVPKAIMPNDLFAFSKLARLHAEGKTESGIAVSEITARQINALYAEKFSDGSNEKQASESADTVEREWENGDECEIIMDGKRGQYVFGCLVYNDHSMAIVFTGNGHMTIPVCRLLKPETESERLERERLESTYDLYSFIAGPMACEYNDFINPQSVNVALLKDIWLKIADKTNYRKESK